MLRRNVHVTRFFIDISGELALRGYGKAPESEPSLTRWSYGMAVLPLMANLGVRVTL